MVLTISGLIAVYAHSGSITVIALGLSYAILEATAFRLVERAQGVAKHQLQNGESVIYSARGLLSQPSKSALPPQEQWVALARDVSAAASILTGFAALSLESLRFGGISYYGLIDQALGENWVAGQGFLSIPYALGIVLVHMVKSGSLLLMVRKWIHHMLCESRGLKAYLISRQGMGAHLQSSQPRNAL